MGKLSDAKTLGGIGSILQIIPVLSIVGYILTLIAVKYISDEVNDSTIFSDMLLAVITGIVGVAVGALVIIFGALSSVFTAGWSAFFGGLTFLAIIWVALIVSSIFVRRAFEKMAARLNVGTFRTAGTLYFVGALLTIVLVGFIILFVAFILQVVAFFSIHEAQPTMQAPMSSQAGFKYCASCGNQMPVLAVFCPKCGARQS
jgi:uncharacterized membrane protein